MTYNDLNIISSKMESLHEKILNSKFAEQVTESEMMSLILAVGELNRQKAELEDLREIVFTNRTEAIKEFAERLKDVFVTIDGTFECWEVEEHIDSLVKEMIGENNG